MNEAKEKFATMVDQMARHLEGSPSSVIFNHAQLTRYRQRSGDMVV
jgi:hypothetical protein